MKKSLIALAVFGSFVGAASAQSSITVFGVVDLSANSYKNGSTSIKTMDNNQLNSNRLGFRGVEDLGGGMTASFWLEAGMSNDVGNAGGGNGQTGVTAFFNRRSTVSLSGGFGEIRLGRDYVNTFSTIAGADAYGANGFGSGINLYLGLSGVSPVGLGSGAGTAVRANNMVGYFLPGNLGGLYGSVQVAAGEGAPNAAASGNKYTGGRLGYAAGPLDVSASVAQTTVGTSDKYKVANIGGSYDFGLAKAYAFVDQRKFGSLKYTTYQLSAGVPLGQGEFRASYAKGNAEGGTIAANDASLFGVEYIYNLSKRTALYTQYGRLSNKGASAIALGGSVSTADAKTGGFTSTGYGAGIRHAF